MRRGEKPDMRTEVMEYYQLTRSLRGAGYYETAHHRQLLRDVKQAVYDGSLVALTGVVGAGKTTTLRRLHETLTKENRVILSRSIAVEKARVTIGTLITALYCDLTTEKELKIPKVTELRDREVLAMALKRKKPVVLVVEEALMNFTTSRSPGWKRLTGNVPGWWCEAVRASGRMAKAAQRSAQSPASKKLVAGRRSFPWKGSLAASTRIHRMADWRLRG